MFIKKYYSHLMLLLSIVVVSILLLRDIYNPFYSYIGDETAFFFQAKDIIEKGFSEFSGFSQSGVYGYHPMLDSMYNAIVMKMFGINVFGWKIANVFVLGISTLLVYLIGDEIYDRKTGLIASIFFTFSHYVLGYAHIGYNNLNALIPFLIAVLFFFRSIRTNSPIDSFISGLFSGLSFYTFYSARLILFLLGPFIVFKGKRRLFFIAGFLLLFLPFYFENQEHIIEESLKKSFTDTEYQSPAYKGVKNFFGGLFFGKFITLHHYVIGPLVNIFLAIPFVIGLGYSMFPIKKISLRNLLLFMWFFVLSMFIVVTFHEDTIPTTRLHIIIPVIALLGAYGLTKRIKNTIALGIFLLVYIATSLFTTYISTPQKFHPRQPALALTLAMKNPHIQTCRLEGDTELNALVELQEIYEVYNIQTISTANMNDCKLIIVSPSYHDQTFLTVDSNISGPLQYTNIAGSSINYYIRNNVR